MKTSDKLSAWASFAEIVSGMAVVVTLVLLVLEVQENTETMRTAAQQEAARAAVDGFRFIAEGPVTDILVRQVAGDPLSPAEATRVQSFSTWGLRVVESQYVLHESGNLGAEDRRALRYRNEAVLSALPPMM